MVCHPQALLYPQERTSSMAEVKKNLQDKVKSLKRRRGSDPLPFKNALNGQLAELNQIMDFVKRLGNGSSEGRGLYDAMLAIPHVTASKQVWMRVLKAWSLEAGLLGHLFLFFFWFLLHAEFIRKTNGFAIAAIIYNIFCVGMVAGKGLVE